MLTRPRVPTARNNRMQEFEKLGVFYLGKRLEAAGGELTAEPVLYDSRDLTTHAVIIGMTGSGKTGLGIAMIEEAALDRVPVIAIDPKGDLGNLLLTFPELRPADFVPWVDARAAAEAGHTPESFAAAQAALWKTGLAEWEQSPQRIAHLRAAADFAICTPGSTAGLPLSVLKELSAPPEAQGKDPELYRERLQGTVAGLLALLGMTADPLTSREHILLANLLDHSWQHGKSLDLATLVAQVQRPPFERLGVLDLQSFFPAAERQSLALRINNLLAAPGFASWTQGAPLCADTLFFTANGQPRVSVISIAHLSDAQRMFVVTLLLAELIGWMRRQSGTPSLRAILYMDEVFGYMPPTADPPTKSLLLTLLKQARAVGLGVVLSTQNPVDLDYKGLANAGTWFIGRLQTGRDRARLLEGLRGSAGGERLDTDSLAETLAGLGKRQFLLHDVNEQRPCVFATRWVMSYLAGPLTREQIRSLMSDRTPPAAPAPAVPAVRNPSSARVVLATGLRQIFVPAPRLPQAGERLVYQPRLLAVAAAAYIDADLGVNERREFVLAADPPHGAGAVDWTGAEELSVAAADLEREPEPDAVFSEVLAVMTDVANYRDWEQQLRRWIGIERALVLYRSPRLRETSRVGESERDFRIRLQQLGKEQRDLAVARLRQKYAAKLGELESRERRAAQARETQAEQARDARLGAAVSLSTSLLGALFGRGRALSSAARVETAVRRTGRIARESAELRRAEETLVQVRAAREALHAELQREVDALDGRFDALSEPLKEMRVRPRAGDIEVRFFGVGWIPYIEDSTGQLHRL